MSEAFTILTDISITSGSNVITVNSAEQISQYRSGDIVFFDDAAANGVPRLVTSISGSDITLSANVGFTITNGSAVIKADRVDMRKALTTVETNNVNWSAYFPAFMTWMTSSGETAALPDGAGGTVDVKTPNYLDTLSADVSSAVQDAAQLESDITDMQADLAAMQPSIDDFNAKWPVFNNNYQTVIDDIAEFQTVDKPAAIDAKDKAIAYAVTAEDVQISGTSDYSAMHWAIKAAASAAEAGAIAGGDFATNSRVDNLETSLQDDIDNAYIMALAGI